jgi:hypothetical protein
MSVRLATLAAAMIITKAAAPMRSHSGGARTSRKGSTATLKPEPAS